MQAGLTLALAHRLVVLMTVRWFVGVEWVGGRGVLCLLEHLAAQDGDRPLDLDG